jgi:hypothetical protein
MRRAFMPAVVDELRARTGYNPRQRQGTAVRLMLTMVEGFLAGQTLTFTSLRAIFVTRRACRSGGRRVRSLARIEAYADLDEAEPDGSGPHGATALPVLVGSIWSAACNEPEGS